MMQDKNTPEQRGHIATWISGIFSTFNLHGLMGRWGAWIVLLASLLITFNAWYFARGEATKRAQARFDFRVKTIETSIYERLQAYEFLLRGGSALFASSDEVTREEWRTYITKLQINQYYPGIQGVGFSKRILPSEKAAHLRQIRGEGFPQYTIKPDGERPEYTSIIFLEPFDWRNQRAFGYDMFSEPTRKEAMIRARDTGIAALSGKVTLVQETAKDIQSGFLIYLAAYRKGEPLETQEQRRKALMGYVYSPFRMNDFMKGILLEKEGYVYLNIFDGDKPLKETLLYDSNPAEGLHNHLEDRYFATHQSILEYAGHRWLLCFVSSKYFEESIETGSTYFILLLGIIISLLLFGMLLSLTKSRSQAIALASTTLDLEKVNIVLRKEITERKQAEEELQRYSSELVKSNKELQDALANIKTLGSMLPICASCKKIRDDKGYWRQVETYISAHTETVFTSGICPECEKKMYEELEKLKKEMT
jgi:CHASE1-domain containing sensor protein